MKIKSCVNCGGKVLPLVNHSLRATVAGVPFERTLRVQRCTACGEIYLPAGVLGEFERAAALELARSGADQPAALKFIRKAAGLKAVELSALLGLTPQHLSRLENGKATADRRTVALVAALLEDRVAGTTRTADQLRAIGRPRKLKGTVHLDGGAGSAR